MILLLDNHDSYTWNLAHLVARVTGRMPRVVQNDAVDLAGIRALQPDAILISPGPGRPGEDRDLGVSADVLRHLDVPILGVCLGHQGLCWAAGGRVVHAPAPMHGRIHPLRHDGHGIFEGLPQDLPVVRYHSLMVQTPLPEGLTASAWAPDGVVMALRDHTREHLRIGVQFHPESIGTLHGQELIARFLKQAGVADRYGTLAPHAESNRSEHDLETRNSKLETRDSAPAATSENPTPTRILTRRLALSIDVEAAFERLVHGRFCATWLDSSGQQGASPSRWSVLGAADGPLGRHLTWRHGEPPVLHRKGLPPEPLDVPLEEAIRAPLREHRADLDVPFPFVGGWVGWFGYGCKARWHHGAPTPDEAPDVSLAFLDRVLVVDHHEGAVWLVAVVRPGEGDAARAWFATTTSALRQLAPLPPPSAPATAPLVPTVDRPAYLQAIHRAQELITDGESYEICLTQRLQTGPLADPLATFRLLRRRNPAPYGAWLAHGDTVVLSTSPEQFLAVDRAGRVQARPIKGTIARHADPVRDRAAADTLASSEKDRAENLMIVDLLRNDLGRVSQPGSVRVPSLMAVEPFATVHHLVSTIQGDLAAEHDAMDALVAAFPPGSMTGAPKERTVEILDALEPGPRGIYSGALGYLSVNGTADFAVVIRTLICCAERTHTGVGGAIIALSNPAAEWEEALLKARALDEVLAGPGATSRDTRFKSWSD